MCREAGMTGRDIVVPALPRPDSGGAIADQLEFDHGHPDALNEWEPRFTLSLAQRHRPPAEASSAQSCTSFAGSVGVPQRGRRHERRDNRPRTRCCIPLRRLVARLLSRASLKRPDPGTARQPSRADRVLSCRVLSGRCSCRADPAWAAGWRWINRAVRSPRPGTPTRSRRATTREADRRCALLLATGDRCPR